MICLYQSRSHQLLIRSSNNTKFSFDSSCNSCSVCINHGVMFTVYRTWNIKGYKCMYKCIAHIEDGTHIFAESLIFLTHVQIIHWIGTNMYNHENKNVYSPFQLSICIMKSTATSNCVVSDWSSNYFVSKHSLGILNIWYRLDSIIAETRCRSIV